MSTLVAKPTQCQKVLKALEDADGDWVNGRYFLHELYLSQYHARIWELQRKGYKIEASEDTDALGFKSYRLVRETLFDK
jgi:hypothetical protein